MFESLVSYLLPESGNGGITGALSSVAGNALNAGGNAVESTFSTAMKSWMANKTGLADNLGKMRADYMNSAYPGTNAWEQLQGSVGQSPQVSPDVESQTKSQERIAKISAIGSVLGTAGDVGAETALQMARAIQGNDYRSGAISMPGQSGAMRRRAQSAVDMIVAAIREGQLRIEHNRLVIADRDSVRAMLGEVNDTLGDMTPENMREVWAQLVTQRTHDDEFDIRGATVQQLLRMAGMDVNDFPELRELDERDERVTPSPVLPRDGNPDIREPADFRTRTR